jgi:hypothetical protein
MSCWVRGKLARSWGTVVGVSLPFFRPREPGRCWVLGVRWNDKWDKVLPISPLWVIFGSMRSTGTSVWESGRHRRSFGADHVWRATSVACPTSFISVSISKWTAPRSRRRRRPDRGEPTRRNRWWALHLARCELAGSQGLVVLDSSLCSFNHYGLVFS